MSAADLTAEAALLVSKLGDFGIDGRVTEIHPGPVVTTFEVEPAAGVKVNQIVSREDDLALALRAQRIRILAPIPGKGAVGIEIPTGTAGRCISVRCSPPPSIRPAMPPSRCPSAWTSSASRSWPT